MGEEWRRMVKKRTQAYHLQRRVCFYCKFHLELRKARADHWFPLSLGGKNNRFNIVATCDACNRKKANRTPEEYWHSDDLQKLVETRDRMRLHRRKKA